jgi:hypothetical protein
LQTGLQKQTTGAMFVVARTVTRPAGDEYDLCVGGLDHQGTREQNAEKEFFHGWNYLAALRW